MKILVADDDADVVLLCRLALEHAGHEVTDTSDGRDAVQLVHDDHYDLLLLDVMLPGLDGFGVLRELRSPPTTSDIPVVMISARVGEDDRHRGLESGAAAYLKKPFSIDDLTQTVADVAGTRGEATTGVRPSKGAVRPPDPEIEAERLPGEPTLALQAPGAQFSEVLDLAVDAIVTVDEEQRILAFNKGAETLFGYFGEEVVGKPLDVLLPPTAVDVHRKHVVDFARDKATARLMGQRQEIFGRRKDGTQFPAEASIVKLDAGGRPMFTAILRDATERRRADAELRARADQQAAVARLGQLALTGGSAAELMDEVTRELVEVLDVELADVMELAPDRLSLTMRAGVGWNEGVAGAAVVDAGARSHAGFTLASTDPVVVEDLATESRFEPSSLLTTHDVVSGMAATIPGPVRPFGTLGVHTRTRRRFGTDDIHFLQAVSAVLAAAIDRERTQERQRAFLEAAPDATFVVDTRGKIVSMNAQAEVLFGYDRSELAGMAVEALVPERVRDVHVGHRSSYVSSPRTRPMGAGLELSGMRKDGTEVPIDIMLSPVETDEGPMVVVAVRDVTERRRAEAVRDSFLHAVSHELRTPLTSVVGFASMLAQEERVVTPDQERDMLLRLLANAQKLDRLLSDLLDLDRLGRGIVEPQRRVTEIGPLVRNVLEHLPAHDHDISVEVEPHDLTANVDAAQTERILENLIVNAIRHSPTGTPVWVRAAKSPNGMMLTVEDAGEGVPEALRQIIFEPFRRGSPDQASPGTGVGLSLVARFAELHGGRAWVEERAGGGASFKVLLVDPHARMTPG